MLSWTTSLLVHFIERGYTKAYTSDCPALASGDLNRTNKVFDLTYPWEKHVSYQYVNLGIPPKVTKGRFSL